MQIEDTLARMVLQTQPVDDLPGIATEALCEGLDSPALRVLAGSSPTDQAADLWDLLCKAAQELRIAVPDRIGAARRVLRLYLRDIVEQRVSPAEGASRIVKDIQNSVGYELDRTYVGEGLGIDRLVGDYYTYDAASSGCLEFEGRRLTQDEAFEILDRSILDEAKRLLQEAELCAASNGDPLTPAGDTSITEEPPR